jgi:hypothetical protein
MNDSKGNSNMHSHELRGRLDRSELLNIWPIEDPVPPPSIYSRARCQSLELNELLQRNRDEAESSFVTVGGYPDGTNGLVFITSGTPAEFRSKKDMTNVRKRAMDAFLRSESSPKNTRIKKEKRKMGDRKVFDPRVEAGHLDLRGSEGHLSVAQTEPTPDQSDSVERECNNEEHVVGLAGIKDVAEKRRIQNRIAQRNYRRKLKKRLEDFKRRLEEIAPTDEPDNIDPDVLKYQSSNELVVIECVCDIFDDCRFIIPCVTCGRWQHITCYYNLAQGMGSTHQCIQCNPRKLYDNDKHMLERLAQEDSLSDTASTVTQSSKRPKTAGVESSIDFNEDRQSSLADSSMTHTNVKQRKYLPSNAYSATTVTSMDSIEKKIYRPSGLKSTNPALRDVPESVPSTRTHVSQSLDISKKDAESARTFTVDDVVAYIKQLQRQIEEKDTLIQAKDEEIEQLRKVSTYKSESKITSRAEHGKLASFSENDDSSVNNGEETSVDEIPEANLLTESDDTLEAGWNMVQTQLPEDWMWDVEFQQGCWTCTPLDADSPKHYPLRIAGAPVVLPVENQWPLVGGTNPPPDPRPSAPIDCRAEMALDVVRDLFLTFEGSIGFYVLMSGLLQIMVSEDFDTTWASSHLPHKYGGLKVCYIPQNLVATMLPSSTETTKTKPVLSPQNSSLSSLFRQSRTSTGSSNLTLKLNDFIEARPKANHRKEKYSGRIGLKVVKAGNPYLIMSTHIVTEAILAKSNRDALFGRSRGRYEKLDDDWNKQIDIWAGNERIGTIDKSFDPEAETYPTGFHHDITLVKPTTAASVKDIASSISGLGWLKRQEWSVLRQQTSAVRILGPTEDHRSAKSIKCSRPSEILVVGEGIFLNQATTAGSSKSLKDHDMSTWKDLVSRALLYRVHPDFDPPNGHSGVALYAEGSREDGTVGPGIVGFQSFVQRSGHVQNYRMEGPHLEKRLQTGRVAFYGAFEVPEELKREYTIV